MENGTLSVPNDPIIHYIEGDGIGVDITPVMIDVVNAAVDKAYGGEKSIVWSEVLAGEKAFNATGEWCVGGAESAALAAPTHASRRFCMSASLTSTEISSVSASMVMRSPSWTRAIGPPTCASGAT